MDRLNELINDTCKLKSELNKNTCYQYSSWEKVSGEYPKWSNIINNNDSIWEDEFEYNFKKREPTRLCRFNKIKGIRNKKINPVKNIRYKNNNNVANIHLIKIYFAILISREFVEFTHNEDKGVAKFTFNLLDKESHNKKVDVCIDDRILVDKNNNSIIIESPFLQDHLLLKALLKLNKILKVDNTSIISYCSLIIGGIPFILEVDNLSDILILEHSIDDLLDDKPLSILEKAQQCNYISDTIMRAIGGLDMKPYNIYAETLFNLYENNVLVGITLKDSLMYKVDNMRVTDTGKLFITFSNIFGGKNVEVSFENIQYALSKISVLIPLEIDTN